VAAKNLLRAASEKCGAANLGDPKISSATLKGGLDGREPPMTNETESESNEMTVPDAPRAVRNRKRPIAANSD
jgi:hypothetical protein